MTAKPPCDIDAVVKRTLELLRNDALRRQMGSAGQAMVLEQFDWQRMADILEKEYLELAAAKAGAGVK